MENDKHSCGDSSNMTDDKKPCCGEDKSSSSMPAADMGGQTAPGMKMPDAKPMNGQAAAAPMSGMKTPDMKPEAGMTMPDAKPMNGQAAAPMSGMKTPDMKPEAGMGMSGMKTESSMATPEMKPKPDMPMPDPKMGDSTMPGK